MKKALVVVLVLVMALSVVGLVSCAGQTLEGKYSYANPWNPKQSYGCKVQVTVQGDVITKVVVEEDTAEMYNLSAGWTVGGQGEMSPDSEGKTNWRKYGQAMAESFVGLTKKEVLGMKVYVNKVHNPGEPITGNSAVETVKYIPEQLAVVMKGHTVGEDVTLAAGATQSSARLILAVQDALLQAGGDASKNPSCIVVDPDQVVEGEYKYENSWTAGQFYGVAVKVTVKEGKITKIEVTGDTDTLYNISAGWQDDTDDDGKKDTDTVGKKNWLANGKAMADSFVGLSVADVKAIKVNCVEVATQYAPAGQPLSIENAPAALKVVVGGQNGFAEKAGATQSSGRLILAVQNALSKLAY